MIYTYGIFHEEFQETTKEFIYNYFEEEEFVQVDGETLGFSCHLNEMVCLQIGNFENQFVIHPSVIMEFKELLEKKILILQNAKFDLNFLYKKNIWPNRVYDTFLAEGVIHCGIKTEKKDLAHIARKRLGVDLDKSVRASIWKEGLTKRVIEYSADDVKYLEQIKNSQQEDLEKLGLMKALEIENQFVLCLAYIEYCGFKLDKDKWLEKHEGDVLDMQKKMDILDKYIIDNKLSKYINRQLDLFSTEVTTNLNWASPKQVIGLFKDLKIPVEIVEKGEKKLTVEAKHLNKYKKKFDIIPIYIEYKEAEKVVGTYGESFIKQISSVTGRIHTNFKQIMDTSRLSCGGKNKSTGEEYINLQNIPRDKPTRSSFIPEDGNELIVGDFSSQESVILTNLSLEPNLIQFYESGGGDMHAFVASKMYKELEGLTFDDIKENHGEKRYNAKTAGFAINYGGVGATISANSDDGITVEEGEAIYNAYFEAFPELRKYFEKVKKEGLERGYVLISDLTGRKSFIYGYEEYLQLKNKMGRKYWDRWKYLKTKALDSDEYLAKKAEISKYFKIKGEIERKSLNFPIQGQAAEISKIAGILFFEWLKNNDLQNKVLMANIVHDEYVLDCPKELVKKVKKALHNCMLESGKAYCKRIPLKAEVKSGENWGIK